MRTYGKTFYVLCTWDQRENGETKRTLSTPHILKKNNKQNKSHLHGHNVEDAVTEYACHESFSRFRSGDFSIQVITRSGWPTEITSDKMNGTELVRRSVSS